MGEQQQEAASEAERARLKASIEGARAELETAFSQIRGAMREQLDWRAWVGKNPVVAVALVAVVGFRLGRGRWT